MDELRDQVARCRAGLAALGVGRGDRVAAYLPEHPRDGRRLPRHRQPGGDLVVVRPRVRHAQRRRPVAPDRAGGAAGRRRLPLRRQGDRPQGRGGRDPRRPAVAAGDGDGAVPRRGTRGRPPRRVRAVGRPARADRRRTERRRRARVRARAVRPPALRPLLVGHDRPAQGDRPRPRRHPRRAPQGARPAQRPRARRPLLLVLDHGLDDVELPGVGPAGRGDAGAVRRRSRPSGPRRAVADGGRRGRDVLRHLRAVPAGLPQGGGRAGRGRRPVGAAGRGLDRGAAARRGLRVGVRGGQGRRCCCPRSAAAPTCARRSSAAARSCRCGRARSRAATWAPGSRRTTRRAGRWWGSRASW